MWTTLHRALLARRRGADKLDLSRVIAESLAVRAVHGGNWTEPNRSPAMKSKHHLAIDTQRVQVNVVLTKVNRHDVTQLMPLVEGIAHSRANADGPFTTPVCGPIAGTTVTSIGRPCKVETFDTGSAGVELFMAAIWARPDGCWNAPSSDCTSSAGCESAMSDCLRFMKRSSDSGVPSSVGEL